jgi:hypothetical protein
MALTEIAAEGHRQRTRSVGHLARLRGALGRFAVRLNGSGLPKQLDPADQAEIERTVFG